MTIGFKTHSNDYIELITAFTPRPITCEAELIATQNRIKMPALSPNSCLICKDC